MNPEYPRTRPWRTPTIDPKELRRIEREQSKQKAAESSQDGGEA